MDCGLVFVYPLPENTEALYKKNYFLKDEKNNLGGYINYEEDKDINKRAFKNFLVELEKMSIGRNIFDVGAATGYFLDLAALRGWNTAGLEISNYAANIARKKGHNIFLGNLKDVQLSEKLDVITMWDVLEHVKDPFSYIKTANKLLKDGGILIINTIDKGSLWAKLWGKHWLLIIPPEHLYYYSKKNLKILLEKNGFKIIDYRKAGKRFNLSYIFSILLYSYDNKKLFRRLAKFFNNKFFRKFSIYINVRDNILIIAQKNMDI